MPRSSSPRRAEIRPACARRPPRPAFRQPHLRPEADHLRSQDGAAGAGCLGAADAYLRELHPQHPQFERLRQAMLERAARRRRPTAPVRIRAGRVDPARSTSRWPSCASASRCRPPTARTRSTTRRWCCRQGRPEQARLSRAARQRRHPRGPERGVSGRPPAIAQRLIVNMERWRWMPETSAPSTFGTACPSR